MADLVSVIMPAYNAGKYIAQSILSVIGQTYENWELIIVNDGSTDNTEEVILKYVELYKDKIHLYRNAKNSGAATALNVAMSHAKGRYMCWLSADDMYFDTMLETSVEFLEHNPQYDACFSKFVTIDEKGDALSAWAPDEFLNEMKKENSIQPYYNLLMLGNVFHGCSFFGLRDCFIRAGEFKKEFPYATDYEYWVRMAAVAQIGFLDEYNVMGREHPEQGTKQGKNDVDAIKAFCALISDEATLQSLFKKIGREYSKEAIKDCFIYRMYFYKERNEELRELLHGFEVYVAGLLDGERV